MKKKCCLTLWVIACMNIGCLVAGFVACAMIDLKREENPRPIRLIEEIPWMDIKI